MKLDPGMHIGMHLVSFGKPGVTSDISDLSYQIMPFDHEFIIYQSPHERNIKRFGRHYFCHRRVLIPHNAIKTHISDFERYVTYPRIIPETSFTPIALNGKGTIGENLVFDFHHTFPEMRVIRLSLNLH
jgi:hypothetical protein